jgi:hypothetical protein
MKSSQPRRAAAALALALVLSASAAQAQSYYPPQPTYPCNQCQYVRVAPDMCGGYFYCTDGCTWYGPSYCVYPPFPPVSGIVPGPTDCPKGPVPTPYQFQQQQQQAGVALPYNPYMRSPRDFFMWTEAQQETITRQRRPAFVP